MRCSGYWFLCVFAVGCADPQRFTDRAILWREPDTAPIAVPKKNDAFFTWIGLRDAVFLPADRELKLDYFRESTNVNALDEVPDSTWYEDARRVTDEKGAVVGMRHFSYDQMERGYMLDEPPPEPPFVITKGKGAGANLGFQVKDRLGRKYLFKMDPPGRIGMDTSTEVVCTRLAWAAGWKVPKEVLVDLRPSDLQLGKGAKTKNRYGDDIPLDDEMLAQMIDSIPTQKDGTILAVASKWIPGTIIGPFAYYGRRKDDPNDRVPHEDRRDLRGFGVFSMWINNVDTLETNTLDSYDGAPGKGHLVHWQQDVGGSFGSRAEEPLAWWMATDIYLAPSRIFGSLFSLGAVKRPWDGEQVRTRRSREIADYPELGYFDWEHFEPSGWHPVLDNPAFERSTPRDTYWGAKRVLAFDETELRGAIASGRYRPEAAERLFEILWHRRDKIGRAYLSKVAPLDDVHFDEGKLCYDDLWALNRFGGEEMTRYFVSVDGVAQAADTTGAHQCLSLPSKDGYRTVELKVQRPGQRHPGPAMRVVFMEEKGQRRIIGIDRDH